ncbi:MAG: GNAT family N-acetyltransferase [Treponema sp.]|jgi:predicted acetyltransferase|nr:GNAT family N-acetyltransferase [Treponema sp.]
MAEIRKLETDEIIQLSKIWTIVYNQRKDYSKEENQKIDPLGHPANWAWGVFEGKKLIAGMYEVDYLMRFDGNSVKMSGISGVGTLPEARKGGHIRRIFENLLPQAYENGVIFSNLTPFNHDFYRKFGYETACIRKNISISTGDLSDIKSCGQFTHILPGDDTTELAEVHSAYIKNINHGIHRDYWPDNRAWKIFTREDSCATGTFIYLWKDENQKARSYIKYQDVTEDGDHNMSVSELAFTCKKGLYGILGITSCLSAQYSNFKWQMPSFIDSFDLISDAWSIEHNYKPREMTRVVNVKTALELMRRPYAECEYVIEVNDTSLPVNNGKYLVQTGPDGSRVSVTTKNADIFCDILTLSQLITGYRTLENTMLSRQEGLEVHSNIDTLARVFTERPQHVTEYF